MRHPNPSTWNYLHQRRGLVVVAFVPFFNCVEVNVERPGMYLVTQQSALKPANCDSTRQNPLFINALSAEKLSSALSAISADDVADSPSHLKSASAIYSSELAASGLSAF